MINVYTDGGSRGNPGEAAIGVYITSTDEVFIAGFGQRIGVATNNVAEYKAVIGALSYLVSQKDKLEIDNVQFFLDSLLITNQINGLFRVKNPTLRDLLFEVRKKEMELNVKIRYSHIPREQNKKADKLVNNALDNLS